MVNFVCRFEDEKEKEKRRLKQQHDKELQQLKKEFEKKRTQLKETQEEEVKNDCEMCLAQI